MALMSNQFISIWGLGANELVGVEIPQTPVNANIGTYGWRSIGVPSIDVAAGTFCGAYLTAVNGDANRANAEILCTLQVKQDAAPPYTSVLLLRGSGSSGSETGYICWVNPVEQKLYLGKLVAGAGTNLGTATALSLPTEYEDWYVRFRVNGTSLKAKAWRYDAAEPDWQRSETDSDVAAAGWVGPAFVPNVDDVGGFGLPGFISVGTNGESAPRPRTDVELRTWYNNDSNPKVVIAELGVLGTLDDEITANSSLVLISNWPFVTKGSDNHPNQCYDDVILEVPTVRAAANEQLVGRSSLTYGDLLVKNEGGVRDHWLSWNWDGRGFDMFVGGVGWRKWDFMRVMTGTIGEVYASGRDKIGFKIRDKAALLNRKLQTTVIGGTEVNAGAPQPVLFGKCFNIEPLLKSSSTLRYKFHDSDMTGSTGITAVRVSGAAATPTPDLANGEFTLGSIPEGRVTMDAYNDLTNSSVTEAGNTHSRLLQTLIEDRLAMGSTSTYKGLRSGSLSNFGDGAIVGLYVPGDANVMDLLDRVVLSAGGFWYFNILGLFCARQLDVPSEPYDHVLLEDDIQSSPGLVLEKLYLPSEVQQLGFQVNWSPQPDSIVPSVGAAERALYGAEAQFTSVAPYYGGLDKPANHELRRRPQNELTLFYDRADAESEAVRRDRLFRKTCGIFRFVTKYNAPFYDMGETVHLTHSKYGFDGGKAGIIIGYEKNHGNAAATLRILAQIPGQFPITSTLVPIVTAEDF